MMTEQLIFSVMVGLFFVCFGSFSTMLIHRLHHDLPILGKQRSKCPKCDNVLGWKELFPLLSWVFLRGKCKKCGQKISAIYPLMELSFALLGGYFTFHFFESTNLWPMLLVLLFSLIMFWYDVLYFQVDRRISWPAIVLVLIWIFVGSYLGFGRELPWQNYLIGGSIGAAFYAFQYFVSKGRWVGFGDVEFGFFMGIMLGWQHLLLGMFLAYIVGTVIAIPLLIWGGAGRKTALPMGAFLMPALLLMILFGDQINTLYWSLVLPY